MNIVIRGLYDRAHKEYGRILRRRGHMTQSDFRRNSDLYVYDNVHLDDLREARRRGIYIIEEKTLEFLLHERM